MNGTVGCDSSPSASARASFNSVAPPDDLSGGRRVALLLADGVRPWLEDAAQLVEVDAHGLDDRCLLQVSRVLDGFACVEPLLGDLAVLEVAARRHSLERGVELL